MFGRIAKLRRQPRGDRAELTLLLRRHREAVVDFLYRMVQDQAVAEDLAAEVFLRSYRSRGEGTSPSAQLATTLFRMATDLALKEPAMKTSQLPPMADVSENAGHAMACMPAKQRAAVLMH
jgi:RNA polymerase sigma-70 factor (ECF subfamily)